MGGHFGHAAAVSLACSASAVVTQSLFDTLKAHQLLDWLRTPEAVPQTCLACGVNWPTGYIASSVCETIGFSSNVRAWDSFCLPLKPRP